MPKKYCQITKQPRVIANTLVMLTILKSLRLLVGAKKSQVFTLFTGRNGRVRLFFVSFVYLYVNDPFRSLFFFKSFKNIDFVSSQNYSLFSIYFIRVLTERWFNKTVVLLLKNQDILKVCSKKSFFFSVKITIIFKKVCSKKSFVQ